MRFQRKSQYRSERKALYKRHRTMRSRTEHISWCKRVSRRRRRLRRRRYNTTTTKQIVRIRILLIRIIAVAGKDKARATMTGTNAKWRRPRTMRRKIIITAVTTTTTIWFSWNPCISFSWTWCRCRNSRSSLRFKTFSSRNWPASWCRVRTVQLSTFHIGPVTHTPENFCSKCPCNPRRVFCSLLQVTLRFRFTDIRRKTSAGSISYKDKAGVQLYTWGPLL